MPCVEQVHAAWEAVKRDQRDVQALLISVGGVRLELVAIVAEREALLSEMRVAQVREPLLTQ